jgi:hypothetical protein
MKTIKIVRNGNALMLEIPFPSEISPFLSISVRFIHIPLEAITTPPIKSTTQAMVLGMRGKEGGKSGKGQAEGHYAFTSSSFMSLRLSEL